MNRRAIIIVLSAGVALISGQSITSVQAGCRWVGTAPACDAEPSDCKANEDYIERQPQARHVHTPQGLKTPFGEPCVLGSGQKVLCCTKEAPIGDAVNQMGKAIEEAIEDAGEAAVGVPPPPPCPANEMRIKGKCQVPPLLPGGNQGAGGGFIQMFPTCSDGKELDVATKKCVPKAAAVTTCNVTKPGAVYDQSDGNGKKVGELADNAAGVTLIKKSGANWFNVKWPEGAGWVYSGPGYENAISCP